MRLEILQTTPQHLAQLAERMRVGDRLELTCMGLTPSEALKRAYWESIWSRTALLDGEIAASWGVGGSPLGEIGHPWLLTAPAVERVPVKMVRVARAEVGAMLGLFPVLENVVADGYRQACRFIEVVGFQLSDVVAVKGERFRLFRMER